MIATGFSISMGYDGPAKQINSQLPARRPVRPTDDTTYANFCSIAHTPFDSLSPL